MPTRYTPEQVAFNANLGATELLERMGYRLDSLSREGDLVRAFCPIHKDQVRRSLLIDASERTFRCQYTACAAHQGGLIVELYAMYASLDIDAAIEQLGGVPDQDEDIAIAQEADKLIAAKRYDEALLLLEQAFQVNPTNTITRCRKAALLLEMGDREQGHAEYLAAAEDYGVKGELDKTLSIYNLLIIISPKDIKVRKQLAYLFSRLGRPQDAAEHLKWVVDRYLASERIDEAATMCEQMAELTPDEPLVHSMLAGILLEFGSVETAMPEYEKAARLHLERDEAEKAKELALKALRVVPGNPGVKALFARIEERLAAAPAEAAAVESDEADDDDFSQWIASLEGEIERPASKVADTTPISPQDARVLLCRSNLKDLTPEQMQSMEGFLRDMYDDVQRDYDQGTAMAPGELRVIKEFYKSCCVAFEQAKREEAD